jgi:hypothetical protein
MASVLEWGGSILYSTVSWRITFSIDEFEEEGIDVHVNNFHIVNKNSRG